MLRARGTLGSRGRFGVFRSLLPEVRDLICFGLGEITRKGNIAFSNVM